MKTQPFIGTVARAAGVSVQAVRYYERMGLRPVAGRTPSGYRIYPEDTPSRLQFIQEAQALGLRLKDNRQILQIKYGGRSPCSHVRDRLQQKLGEVENRMKAWLASVNTCRTSSQSPNTTG